MVDAARAQEPVCQSVRGCFSCVSVFVLLFFSLRVGHKGERTHMGSVFFVSHTGQEECGKTCFLFFCVGGNEEEEKEEVVEEEKQAPPPHQETVRTWSRAPGPLDDHKPLGGGF